MDMHLTFHLSRFCSKCHMSVRQGNLLSFALYQAIFACLVMRLLVKLLRQLLYMGIYLSCRQRCHIVLSAQPGEWIHMKGSKLQNVKSCASVTFFQFHQPGGSRHCMALDLPHVYDRRALCNEMWLLVAYCVVCLWHFWNSGQLSIKDCYVFQLFSLLFDISAVVCCQVLKVSILVTNIGLVQHLILFPCLTF
jgi:hypothetical protein